MTEPRYTVLVRVHGTDGTELYLQRQVSEPEVGPALGECYAAVDREWWRKLGQKGKEAGRV
jgi:hypothetical protein